jgi:hypothetical protein
VTRRIGIDGVAIELYRTQRQHSPACGGNVLDHDVEVKLLRYCGIGPGRRLVTGGKLEGQARGRITGGDHHPVVHPPDHAADHARFGPAVRDLPAGERPDWAP